MARTLIILTCFSAVAYAQFGNQYQSSFGQNSAFGNPRVQQNTRQQNAIGNQNQYKQNQYQQNQFQQNQYQQDQYQQNQYQQQSSQRQSASSCRESTGRYPVPGSCDRYIECINGTSEEKLCPDGLLFNSNVTFNVYPCQYPNEVACLERSASLQPAQPTDDCPHQFGYYKLGDASNCAGFRNCVNGVAHDFVCPEGLAWSSETYRCEWPDTVADCDAEAFLGFRCPEVPVSRELGPPAGFRFYRSDADCQKYFICIDGRPRALSCGGDSGFDELTSTCVLADEVSSCPAELRAIAARSREAEQQRLAKQLKVDALPPRVKQRF